MTFAFKQTAKASQQERQSEHSFVTPITKARKEQLSREIDELLQGKRKTVSANIAEIIEIISAHEDLFNEPLLK